MIKINGLFLAAESTVKLSVQARKSSSLAVLGKEGLFNLRLDGKGVCALEEQPMSISVITGEPALKKPQVNA